MRGKKSRDSHKRRLGDITAKTSNHRPGIDVHSWVVGKTATEGREFASVITDAAQSRNKVGGAFLRGAFGFTHERQGWVGFWDES